METRTLYPGITLHAEKDTRFKTEYLSVNFICSGSLFDRPHASILSAVLGRGTLNHPTQADLDKVLADLYDASLYTKGYCLGETFIQPFSLSCHKERFIPGETGLRRRARKLLFEMILEPLTEKDGFLSRYVEDEKKNKMDQLSAEKNNKPSYALSRCFSLLCRGEPYDYPASRLRKELPSVSAHSLLEFYRKMLCHAPIEIFYFGEEDLNSLCSDLMNHLSPLFTPKLPLVSDVISFPKPQVCREEERLVANQSTLCLGFKTCVRMGMPGFYALFLLKEIFCDSPVSLLFTNLREKESLCYYCQGSLLSRKGVYLLEFGIDGKDAEKAEKETLAQLEALKTGNFDEEFLFLCKKSLCDGFAEFYDNPAEIEGWYLRQVLAGSALSPKDVSKKIFNMHKKDVQRVANTLILDSVFLLYGTKNSKEEKAL